MAVPSTPNPWPEPISIAMPLDKGSLTVSVPRVLTQDEVDDVEAMLLLVLEHLRRRQIPVASASETPTQR